MIIEESKVEVVEEEKEKNLNPENNEENIEEKKELIKKETDLQNIDNIDSQKISKKQLAIYISAFFGILILILGIIFFAFSIYNISNSEKIAKGVYIYGVDVSALNKQEAKIKLTPIFEEIEKLSDIKLECGTPGNDDYYETSINVSKIDLNYSLDSAIDFAFGIGKTGNIFKDDYDVFNAMVGTVQIDPGYSINNENLLKILNDISKEIPNAVVESSYYIEDSELIITKGSDGFAINIDETERIIDSKLANLSFISEKIEMPLVQASPKPIDLAAIYKEVYKDAKDAYYTTDPYAVYPSSNGVDFAISMDEAKEKLAKSDKEITIKLKTLYPEVTTNMIGKEAFPDLLGSFSTNYVSNANRTTNLKLAAEKINGTVLLPGEVFSYNKIVGERTIAAGYKNAAIYENGQVVDGLGGGICQISTTVFNAALFANLDMVELYNHQFIPSYVGAGRDATVVYGVKDFKFKNTRNYAIKIECTVSGGVASCKIYGLKEKTEYDVSINAKITSRTSSYIQSVTYRTLKLDGKEISTEKIYSCTYKNH